MMNFQNMQSLKQELSRQAKRGMDFILAASIIWFMIGIIWSLDYTAYTKSIFTFSIGGLMLPLAYLFSKLLKTKWKIKGNSLQSLGLWLNVAQLFYFPFLVFILLTYPDYFVMTYAIITGAHLFPYAWLYNTKVYAFSAGFISFGSLLITLYSSLDQLHFVAFFTSGLLLITFILLYKKTHD